MPPMKIQPLDSQAYNESLILRNNDSAKPVLKSRLKRLFDRQFPSVLRNNPTPAPAEFEPSSVCLAKMVQNFIEDSNDVKSAAAKCGRNRCNCFNGNINDSSDDEFDVSGGFNESSTAPSAADFMDMLKSLIPCASVDERHLLAETSKIVEKNKTCKKKDELRKIVTDGLLLLGYDASICRSRWEKSTMPLFPAGEYEYIDVTAEGGDRVIIDLDFRSEFEIARPTAGYKLILQSLPSIFVGKSDRLQQIVSIASESAKQSLKKKGMPVPPWRKVEYMRAKWLSSHIRTTAAAPQSDVVVDQADKVKLAEGEELELIFGEEKTAAAEANSVETEAVAEVGNGEVFPAMSCPWEPPAVKPKRCERGGAKVVTGLASLLREKS